MPNEKGPSTKVGAAVSKQVAQLRKKVDELRDRLDAEIKRRKTAGVLLQGAKKARDQVAAELRLLRQQAAKGATELKKALTDAQRREQAGKAAAAKVEQLKAELAKKTAELKQKTTEFARLAKESLTKAKPIPKEAPLAPPSAPTPKPEAGHGPEPVPPTTDSTSSEGSGG